MSFILLYLAVIVVAVAETSSSYDVEKKVSLTCRTDSFPSCPAEDIALRCDKFHPLGSFTECFNLCKNAFCCIHDSKSKSLSPSCSDQPNCRLYQPCYNIWWKFQDTIGPANFFQFNSLIENFYDQESLIDILLDPASEAFGYQLFNHHFDTDDWKATRKKLEDPEYWVRERSSE